MQNFFLSRSTWHDHSYILSARWVNQTCIVSSTHFSICSWYKRTNFISCTNCCDYPGNRLYSISKLLSPVLTKTFRFWSDEFAIHPTTVGPGNIQAWFKLRMLIQAGCDSRQIPVRYPYHNPRSLTKRITTVWYCLNEYCPRILLRN